MNLLPIGRDGLGLRRKELISAQPSLQSAS